MYNIETTLKFEKDLKLCAKRKYDTSLLLKVIKILRDTGTLPTKYKPHILKGDFNKLWEAHIKPDWLIIWEKNTKTQTIVLRRTGTHSDLF